MFRWARQIRHGIAANGSRCCHPCLGGSRLSIGATRYVAGKQLADRAAGGKIIRSKMSGRDRLVLRAAVDPLNVGPCGNVWGRACWASKALLFGILGVALTAAIAILYADQVWCQR
jgi:hypothetical protein